MRKLLMLLVFCMIGTLAFSQQPKKRLFKSADEIYFSKEKENKKKKLANRDMDQTKWIIESLDKYRRDRATANQIGLLGFGLGGLSFAFADKPQDQKVFGISAGVLVVMSYFLNMNAERNLNKKNLTFTGNGLALRF